MAFENPDCKEVVLYLTEYSRSLLPVEEFRVIDAHLRDCHECRRENIQLEKLSIELDKIIPSVSKTYERDFIYRLFINSKKEPFLIKLISLTIVIFLLLFIMTTIVSSRKNEYPGLKELQQRAENFFNENYYSGQSITHEN